MHINENWIVHKFGGSSVANSKRFINVCNILKGWYELLPGIKQAIIISAMSGVTNALQQCCDEANKTFYDRKGHFGGAHTYQSTLNEVHEKHLCCIRELVEQDSISSEVASDFVRNIDRDVSNIRDILRAISLTGSTPVSMSELVMGHGEVWSAQILTGVLQKRISPSVSCWVDARDVLIVSTPEEEFASDAGPKFTTFERVFLNWERSAANMLIWKKHNTTVHLPVITGYICSTSSGAPSTLKRNGSDYSAALFSALLSARLLLIWTDVPGVFSADPRVVPSASRLPFLTYNECVELSYFGAKVLHPFTIHPCISHGIPIVSKSSLEPLLPGTLISKSHKHTLSIVDETNHSADPLHDLLAPLGVSPSHFDPATTPSRLPVKAFTAIEHVSLLTLNGGSMLGVPGLCARLFTAVHEAEVAVIMISQASSQHAISFAVLDKYESKARTAVERAFYREMNALRSSHQTPMRLCCEKHCSVICAVGEGMAGAMGVLGLLSTAVAKKGVNIKAVTQASSEANVTFVVESNHTWDAIKALHSAVYGAACSGLCDVKSEGCLCEAEKEKLSKVCEIVCFAEEDAANLSHLLGPFYSPLIVVSDSTRPVVASRKQFSIACPSISEEVIASIREQISAVTKLLSFL
eukprot:GDKJ01023627.1.p1 GENE.GDKJ01023627.1~~GDKJ01023627.1.p1  ORF type:complete len:639 (+),score=121.45 GDKJ01023627.1:60-1976(+)